MILYVIIDKIKNKFNENKYSKYTNDSMIKFIIESYKEKYDDDELTKRKNCVETIADFINECETYINKKDKFLQYLNFVEDVINDYDAYFFRLSCDYKIYHMNDNKYIIYNKFNNLSIVELDYDETLNLKLKKTMNIENLKGIYNPILHFEKDTLYWTDFYGGVMKKYRIPKDLLSDEEENVYGFCAINYKNVKLTE